MTNTQKETIESNTLQAFWVGIGSLLSFAVNIVSAMILSRYFAKDDYGTYKQVTYVYNTLLIVFTLGLPKAFNYFLPRAKPEEAKSVTNKITGLLVMIGLLFSLSLFIFSKSIGAALENEDLGKALVYFSLVPVLMLPTMGIESILSTYRKTQLLTFNTIINRVVLFSCIVIPVVWFQGDYILAIKGYVFGSILNLLVSLWFKYLPFRRISNIKTKLTYSDIFKYTLPLFTASIWGVLIQSADQYFISKYFGREVFAEFSNGSIELPFVGMVVGAGTTILGPLFSKYIFENANVQNTILPIWISVFEKTVKILYPILFFTIFFATEIMVLVYGQNYSNSAIYFVIKQSLNFFTMISFSPLILALDETKFYSRVHAIIALFMWLGAFILVFFSNSPYLIVTLFVILNIVKIFIFLKLIAAKFKITIKSLFPLNLIKKIVIFSLISLSSIKFSILLIGINDEFYKLALASLIYFILYVQFTKHYKISYSDIVKPIYDKIVKKSSTK